MGGGGDGQSQQRWRGKEGPEGGPPGPAGAQTHRALVKYTLTRTAVRWCRSLSRADSPATLGRLGRTDRWTRHNAALGTKRGLQPPQVFGVDGWACCPLMKGPPKDKERIVASDVTCFWNSQAGSSRTLNLGPGEVVSEQVGAEAWIRNRRNAVREGESGVRPLGTVI